MSQTKKSRSGCRTGRSGDRLTDSTDSSFMPQHVGISHTRSSTFDISHTRQRYSILHPPPLVTSHTRTLLSTLYTPSFVTSHTHLRHFAHRRFQILKLVQSVRARFANRNTLLNTFINTLGAVDMWITRLRALTGAAMVGQLEKCKR